jgi:hypothetical protein
VSVTRFARNLDANDAPGSSPISLYRVRTSRGVGGEKGAEMSSHPANLGQRHPWPEGREYSDRQVKYATRPRLVTKLRDGSRGHRARSCVANSRP